MLTSERWSRVREIFDATFELPEPARAARLVDLCRDDARLRAEVDHLLSAHDKIGDSFLDYPVVRTAVTVGADVDLNDTSPVRHPTGYRVSHYRIESFIGAGGMGSVYRARDVALGRPAALKMLPATFSPALQQRLRDEAEACAHLQHPNIATYFESGGTAEGSFIAMELVDGETLRAVLRNGALSVDRAVAIGCALLEALSHAHSVGILHRDIKPENVMIAGATSAKLLDFGLAKHFVPGPSGEALTEDMANGAVVGTIGYMSPEQIANAHLDERSDLFQVGAVLYEALSGRPAFPGDTIVARLAAVLTCVPAPLPEQVPPNISAIVFRALEREPSRRYATASAFLADLRNTDRGWRPPASESTLAVLGFVNETSDASHAWLATGIAETLSAEFNRVERLHVVPAERVLAVATSDLKDSLDDRRAAIVGQRLGCGWVLAGRYAALGEALRVTVTLVEAASERVVLSRSFAGALAQVFTTQDQIVAAVLETLSLSRDSAATPAAPDMSAYEQYVRGRRLFLRLEKGSLDQARACYEAAIDIEPGYAPALSGLAGFYAMRFTFTTERHTLDMAAEYARRAVAADAGSAEARNWLGYSLFRYGDLEQSEREFAEARRLQPEWFFPYYFGSVVALLMHKTDEAIALGQFAVVLESRQSFPMLALACIYTGAGHYDEALWCFERAALIEREHAGAAQWPGLSGFHAECLRRIGRLDEARTLCLAAIDDVERSDHMYRDSVRVFCLVTLGRIAHEQNDQDAARAAFRQALAHLRGRERTLAGGWLAVQALAGLAALDRDIAAFDKAVALNLKKDRYDFSWFYFCWKDTAWLTLSRAADALGLMAAAATMRGRAVAAGAFDARDSTSLTFPPGHGMFNEPRLG